MKRMVFCVLTMATLCGVQAHEDRSRTPDGECVVIEGGHDGNGSNSASTSVTAGGGRTSSSPSTGGQSMSVHSGNGSSSVAGSTSSDGSTVITGSGGDCVIHSDHARKERN